MLNANYLTVLNSPKKDNLLILPFNKFNGYFLFFGKLCISGFLKQTEQEKEVFLIVVFHQFIKYNKRVELSLTIISVVMNFIILPSILRPIILTIIETRSLVKNTFFV